MNYVAFISYSHEDAAIAERLRVWLECFRVPDHVTSPAPLRHREKLTPIFLDKDLPAGGALSATLKSKLEASFSLVVVCSPTLADQGGLARRYGTSNEWRMADPSCPSW